MEKGHVAMFIAENDIQKWTGIIKHCNKGKKPWGQMPLSLSYGIVKQVRKELIVDAWYFENASQTIKDKNVDRIGTVYQSLYLWGNVAK